MSASLLRDSTQVRLEQEIDENWRGAYDILVLPLEQELGIEQTSGLVEPNFLGFVGRGGISLSQLEEIRRLDDVELAAPIMTVGLLRHTDPVPSLFASQLPGTPTLYQLTLEATTDDGLGERLIQTEAGRLVLGPAELDSTGPLPFLSDLDFSWAADGVEIAFAPLPSIGGIAVAVDPVAEKELLGPSADFLDPLIAANGAGRTAGTFPSSRIPSDAFPLEALEIEFARDTPADAARSVVPMVVSERLYAELSIEITIDELAAYQQYPESIDRAIGSGGAPRDRFQAELRGSELIRPFAAPSLTVLWPGSSPPNGTTYVSSTPSAIEPMLIGRPAYEPRTARTGSGAPSFTIEFVGPVTAGGQAAGTAPRPNGTRPQAVSLGIEAAYRRLEDAPGSALRAPLFAPLGTYDLASLILPNNPLNYVPFGAYYPPNTHHIADPQGASLPPRAMSSTLNPLGLLSVPPLAVLDLAGAQSLRGDVSIDAVRIRVAEIDAFTPEAKDRLQDVALQLRGMGLNGRIVAGSSPQPVEVYVPGYYQEPDTRDLGWISQTWTTLGAAQRVSSSFGATNTILLGLAIATAGAFAVGVSLARQSARLKDIHVFRALGWGEGEITRWYLSEALIGGAVLLVVAAVTWIIARGAPEGLVVALALAVVYPVGELLGWLSVSRLSARSESIVGGEVSLRPAARPVVRTPVGYGLRALRSRPIRAIALAGPLVISGVAVGFGIAVLTASRDQAGPTLLAGFLADALHLNQVAMLASIVLGSAGLAAFLLRIDARDRLTEWRSLAAAGWSLSPMMSARIAEVAPISLVASALVAGTVVALGRATGTAVPLYAILIGTAIVFLVAAIGTAFSILKIWNSSFR